MRVFFFFDDEVIYHPPMLDRIVSVAPHTWVGLGLNTKDVLGKYMRKHIPDVGILAAIKLASLKYGRQMYSRLLTPITGKAMTLSDVARKHGIPVFPTTNINAPEYLDHIGKLEPDVIISANSLIFKKRVLDLPKIGCINRHSGLLPSYGGILPVMQAVAHGEKEVGVTIHFMDEGIDTGEVIIQRAVPISPHDTIKTLYDRCFAASADLVVEALDILQNNRPFVTTAPRPQKSYYSFPTDEDWRLFKQRGIPFA